MSSLHDEGLAAFIRQIRFRPDWAGLVGVEREVFLIDPNTGYPVPEAERVLKAVPRLMAAGTYSYELSACQVEYQTVPVRLAVLPDALRALDANLRETVAESGLALLYREVAPENMPLDVYPDPDDRYAEIAAAMSEDVLRAACRVTGTHVHVGMPDLVTAQRVYKRVIKRTDELIDLGDGSGGERMQLYRQVSPRCDPPKFDSIEQLYELAQAQGFVENLRNWWALIRITRYGTIECRVFGNTESIDRVVSWATRFHELCLEAM